MLSKVLKTSLPLTPILSRKLLSWKLLLLEEARYWVSLCNNYLIYFGVTSGIIAHLILNQVVDGDEPLVDHHSAGVEGPLCQQGCQRQEGGVWDIGVIGVVQYY